MSNSNLVRFPLQRKLGKTREYFFLVSGIPQFNGGGSFVYKASSKKKVEDYVKPHNNLGVARIQQMYTDEYIFATNGNIIHIPSQVSPPQLQSE